MSIDLMRFKPHFLKYGMPTYTSQKFQNKTRFYLHFLTCAGLAVQQEKLRSAISKFANAHLHISF